MSREIKYRYTYVRKNGHVFHQDFTLAEIENGDVATWMRANNINSDNVYRRQYTGLLDTHKKEIWEKDVCGYLGAGKEEECFTIIFEDGAFRKLYKDWDMTLSKPEITAYEISLVQIEVRGNLYENPELVGK